MKTVSFCAVVLSLMLAGCGGSVCSRLDSVGKTMKSKTSACPNVNFTVGVTQAQCDAQLKNCTSDDQTKMHKWLDCLERLPACVAGKEDDFTNAAIKCANDNLSGMSQACQKGITGQ